MSFVTTQSEAPLQGIGLVVTSVIYCVAFALIATANSSAATSADQTRPTTTLSTSNPNRVLSTSAAAAPSRIGCRNPPRHRRGVLVGDRDHRDERDRTHQDPLLLAGRNAGHVRTQIVQQVHAVIDHSDKHQRTPPQNRVQWGTSRRC